ncbi:MAG: efflux RND transporter periplasmic adaptor subunit [Arenimonas sp.]|uniref:efflux RND transporter periplasmic adaptor subunit n=1 Tax=Arenimonas sp. TaxID=1872635 RepID=UPI0025C68E5B|nr:efflux RND transporter periplasmic adaptor subunit [Arenimonas sp.]MBW8366379.1 efflux RND transporter periplasmic adaptor subunit [Arenimonas sp.]
MATVRTASRFSLLLAVSGALALSGCGGEPAPEAMPTPEVAVVTLKDQPVRLTRELAGRTTPFLVAEVRPQVTGIITRRLFEEGSMVKAGDALYDIDASAYRASRDSARAGLARAQAALTSARLSANRSKELAAAKLVSAQDNERAAAAFQQAQADVAAARADLQATEVTLGYAHITAPISGRIGKSSVTQGALVTANQAQALATIQQLDPMYVDLAQSSSELLALRKEMAAGTLERGDGVPVKILLEDGSDYGQDGRMEFADVTVDPTTGSYALRVRVPNAENFLLPGMYVRAVVDMGQRPNGVLAPQQGITRDAKGQAVAMVVTPEGKVEQRVVQASRTIGDQWLVDEGLRAGDRVIVEGLQKVQPGGDAKAVEAAAATAGASVPSPPAPAAAASK